MELEILIRVNGGEPKWVAASKLSELFVKKKRKVNSPSPPKPNELKGFDHWWNLYDKKVGKKAAQLIWKNKINPHIFEKEGKIYSNLYKRILDHTDQYVKDKEKRYRKDPERYLKHKTYNDEIIKQDKRIDIKEYKHDTTGMPMGKCETCGKKDTYRNQWELYQGSRCCGAKVLPFN
tara:strand:+ start:57 stop:587 length:531 start_codon:yes stop_codon:yes gene_type:complete